MELSLRANLTVKIVLLLAGTLLVLAAVAFLRARESVGDLSGRVVSLSARLTRQRITGLLDQAESQGRLMAGLVAPGLGGGQAATDASAFLALAKRSLTVMAANAEFGAVTYTLDRTGESVQTVRRANGELTVYLGRIGANGSMSVQAFRPFGDQLEPVAEAVPRLRDLRQTPWYGWVRAEGEQAWAETTLAPLPNGGETPRVTCATPVFGPDNRFLGAVTVEFTVTELSRFLQTIQVGRTGSAFLVERAADRSLRLVAHPDANRLLIASAGRERLATVDEFADPAVARLLDLLSAEAAPLRVDEPVRTAFSAGGAAWVGAYQAVGGDRRPSWVMAVLVRDEEFTAGVWQAGREFALLGFGALGVGVLLSLLLARSVARPLQRLAEETALVREFDLAARAVPPSGIREIDALAVGMEQMKTGLRSFEKLVPAEYARWLVRSGQEARLGGERRHITTYFADIVGFTALSERMAPEDLVQVLAEYLDVLSSEVLRAGGTVDKFNGDDVMAFWGAPAASPDHAFTACRAALQSQATLAQLRGDWAARGIPTLRASFGVSTGDVVVGNVGSRQRMNYTVIGDAVNLASRLQGLNKRYGTEILVSEQTQREAGDRIVTRLVDWADVEGRAEREPVYELLCLREGAPPDVLDLALAHAEGVRLIESGRYAEAQAAFTALLASRPNDQAVRTLLARAVEWRSLPPEEAAESIPRPGLGLDRGQ